MKLYKRFLVHVRRAFRRPIDELSQLERLIRYLIDLFRYGARQLRKDRAGDMAASLTYRTIFSLVPVAVLSMLMVRAFVDQEDARKWLRGSVYDFLGWSALSYEEPSASQVQLPLVAPEPGGKQVPPLEPKGSSPPDPLAQMQARLDQRLDELIEHAWNASLGKLGLLGGALFVWAALALLVNLEDAFNTICNAPSGRPWRARLANYWAVLTLGPATVAGILFGLQRLIHWGITTEPWGWFGHVFFGLLDRSSELLASWALLFTMYTLVPNTRMAWRPTLVGSLAAAVAWQGAKGLFQLYVVTARPYSELYGSLGLIALFLFWLYLTWLIVLYGLELSYVIQTVSRRQMAAQWLEEKGTESYDPLWLIPALVAVGRAFEQGKTVSLDQLVHVLQLPARVVSRITQHLEQKGYLHSVESHQDGPARYALARPAEQIHLEELVRWARQQFLADRLRRHQQAWQAVDRMLQEAMNRFQGTTLAQLLRSELSESGRKVVPSTSTSVSSALPSEAHTPSS